MIKVIQFIHGFSMGGAETLVKDYAIGLDKTKIDLTMLCYERFNSPYEMILKDAHIRVNYICDEMPHRGKNTLLTKSLNKMQRYSFVRKRIRLIDADIIHIHLPLNRYIKYAKPNKNITLFYTQHFEVKRLVTLFPKEVKAIRWLLCHYNMYLIALNNSMKIELEDLFHTEKVLVFNNGINIEKFQADVDVEQIREKIGVPKNAYVIGHVGRFSEIKNHSFLVDVFAEYRKKNPNSFLLMVGKGETMENVQNKIRKLGLENQTLILSDRTDVPELMKVMDTLVFPSFSEGMPVTLVEAQVSGVKCLVADTVSEEIRVSNLIKYKNLSDTAESWAMEIENWKNAEPQFYNLDKWDMQQIVRKLEETYYGLCKGKVEER